MDIYNKEDLIRIMSFVYGSVKASVPLLYKAREKAESGLYEYFTQHIDEETGHDAMTLHDLRGLGVEPVIPHYSAQFAGSQYYLLEFEHPSILLGYMRALEANVMTPEEVDKLSAHHGVELTALKHHAIHDPEHKKDLDRMIDGLTPEQKARVLWNEENTRFMMMNARI